MCVLVPWYLEENELNPETGQVQVALLVGIETFLVVKFKKNLECGIGTCLFTCQDTSTRNQ